MSRSQKKLAKEEAGRLLVEGIQESLDRSLSPVSGGSFKRKLKDGGRSILFEEGDLRDAIKSVNRTGDEIEIGIWKSSELKKSFNHNIGDTLPQRQFIPDEDQSFKKKYTEKVEKRIREIKNNSESTEKRTLSSLLDEAFAQSTVDSDSEDSGISLTIGGLLDVLNGN